MGFILFVYDSQIFNQTDFTAYAVKIINDIEQEFELGVVEKELYVDDIFLDGSYSLKIYSKGSNGPSFFSSKLYNNQYYRFSYLSKRVNDALGGPVYFLL
jgi:hypothetical protein